jgi:hypothetical protein
MQIRVKRATLPQTDSITELAAYWDTHDLTDHDEELEEVANPFDKREKQTVVQVPLESAQIASAQKIADSRGITLPVLLQQWIGEHVGL